MPTVLLANACWLVLAGAGWCWLMLLQRSSADLVGKKLRDAAWACDAAQLLRHLDVSGVILYFYNRCGTQTSPVTF